MLYDSPCDEPGYFDHEYGQEINDCFLDEEGILQNREDCREYEEYCRSVGSP